MFTVQLPTVLFLGGREDWKRVSMYWEPSLSQTII